MDTLTLSQLAGELRAHDIACEVHAPTTTDPVITGAACDSRAVRAGDIFVCKGAAFRPAFLSSAREAGAVAYLADAVGVRYFSHVSRIGEMIHYLFTVCHKYFLLSGCWNFYCYESLLALARLAGRISK